MNVEQAKQIIRQQGLCILLGCHQCPAHNTEDCVKITDVQIIEAFETLRKEAAQ